MISIKSQKEISIIQEGGKILAEIMKELKKQVAPGITTKELDKRAEALVFKYGAVPAFKGYEGFPATLCVAVNSGVVHGVPSDDKLKQGDILSLDMGIKYKGFFTDMAITVPVQGPSSGSFDFEAVRLIRVTKKALKLAIKKAKVGNTVGDIGNTIQRYIEYQGFNVVRDLCGHGIGRALHQEPQILNYGKRRKGPEIEQGMVFCLEPMAAMGSGKIKKSADGFGFETQDGSLSAHFEHTIAITKKGSQVLTKFDK